MNIYELSWSWDGYYIPYLFTHPESKDRHEFKKDVKNLFLKYTDEFMSEIRDMIGAEDCIKFVAGKLPELGYTKFKTIKANVFGCYIIESEKEYEDLKFAEDFIGFNLLRRIIAHNKYKKKRKYS